MLPKSSARTARGAKEKRGWEKTTAAPPPRPRPRKAGKKKMGVADPPVRPRRPPVHRRDEAAVELRALLPGAGVAPRVDPRPEGDGVGEVAELGAVAGFRRLFPLADAGVVVELLQALEHRLVLEVVEFLPAEEVRPALHVAGADFGVEVLLQKRDVLEEKLLLEGFRPRRDDHLAAAAQRGDEIGKRFTCAGARFDDEMLFLLEGLLDRLRHRELPLPELVLRMRARQQPLGPEALPERHLRLFDLFRHRRDGIPRPRLQ